jgi:hypothetical protein
MRHDLVLGGVSALFGASLQANSRGIAPRNPNPSDIIDWVVGGLSATVTTQ